MSLMLMLGACFCCYKVGTCRGYLEGTKDVEELYNKCREEKK